MKKLRMQFVLAATVSALALGACSEVAPLSPGGGPSLDVVGEPALVFMHKFGPAASYQFNLDATTGELLVGNPLTLNTADGFTLVWRATDQVAGTFTATEILTPGVQLDSIWITRIVRDANGFLTEGPQTKYVGTNQLTLDVSYDLGAYILLYNSEVEVPTGGEGCTPGYWKQSQHFDSWTAPYAPTTSFSAVFADAFPGQTLLSVLKQGGGGLKALGRHAVAALLDAASPGVDYDLSTAQVISMFNAAYASTSYEATKDQFEKLNQQICRLN